LTPENLPIQPRRETFGRTTPSVDTAGDHLNENELWPATNLWASPELPTLVFCLESGWSLGGQAARDLMMATILVLFGRSASEPLTCCLPFLRYLIPQKVDNSKWQNRQLGLNAFDSRIQVGVNKKETAPQPIFTTTPV
jgi:hypothetical protein